MMPRESVQSGAANLARYERKGRTLDPGLIQQEDYAAMRQVP